MKMKKLVAIGAAAAMSMAMCVNVFAETAATSAKVNDAKTGISLVNKGTDLSASDKQYTVVIFKEGVKEDGTTPISASNLTAAEIEYINQGLVGEEFWANMLTKNAITDGTYVVRIGGETGAVTAESGVYEYTVSLKNNILYGDANQDGAIDTSDANVVLKHYIGTSLLTQGTDAYKAANATRDTQGTIDTSDANLILKAYIGTGVIDQTQE